MTRHHAEGKLVFRLVLRFARPYEGIRRKWVC
jgi:hypothetical protein